MQQLYEFYQLYAAELTLGSAAGATVLLLWVMILQWRVHTLQQRYRAAMGGAAGIDLESWLVEQRATQEGLAERLLALEADHHALQETVQQHAGRVGVVRFNPFQDTGSNQSFAVAWLDEAENGVVLSSLHSRNGVRVYAKPLERGTSNYTLSEEEEEAIKQARRA